MKSIRSCLSRNVGFVVAVGSCFVLLFGLTPYHQSVSRALTIENEAVYSVVVDVNAGQLDSLLQNAQLCIYNSARINLYNFLNLSSSLGYECSDLSAMDNLARLESGLRVKLFAKTSYRLVPAGDSHFEAKIILGEVPLAYEMWRRISGVDVSTHKLFETPGQSARPITTSAQFIRER